jgi:hypothetical protein
MMHALRRSLFAAALLALAACQQPATNKGAEKAATNASGEAAPQVASEMDVVLAMLDLANVNSEDVVMDLGSGDGRIPIAAAKEKNARGVGVEIDRALIRQSERNAREARVLEKVRFRQEDLFSTALNDVTVLTLYLLPEINLQLRPRILTQMRPGTRVVSNTWDMGEWRPDSRRTLGSTNIFLWIVPARVEGSWRLTQGAMTAELTLTQLFQDISGRLGEGAVSEAVLNGDTIAFTANPGDGSRRFRGRVEGDRIIGDGWEAVRIGT